MRYVYDLALLGAPLLLVGGAVAVDLRSRRGFGLALLALVLIGLIVWGIVAFEQTLQRAPSSEQFAIGIVEVVYFLIGCYLTILLWIGALIEAGVARQRWWLVGLIVAALLSGVIVLGGTPLLNLRALGLGFIAGDTWLALILLLPTVTILAYGFGRVMRRPARQPAPRPRERTA